MKRFLTAAFLLLTAGILAAQNTSGASVPRPKMLAAQHQRQSAAGAAQSQVPAITTSSPRRATVTPARSVPPPASQVPTQSAPPQTPSPGNPQAAQGPSQTSAQATVPYEPKVPASAPRVTYQNGQLTVVAENASLGEVLSSIRAATGMRIEGSSGGSERVTAKVGPAPVRDVLLSLLEGSRYDFAILGAAADPQKVERVILTPRLASSANTSASSAPQRQAEEVASPAQPPAGEDDDNEGFAAPAATTPPPPGATPGQVKTPEQLLEDLRKIEADKAQQQQQAQPAQPTDPNAPRPTRPERPK